MTAILARDEAKDVVDLWTIATNEKINWPEIFRNSSSKAVGIFPPAIAERIKTFPVELLDKIKWIDEKSYQREKFAGDIEKIIEEMLEIEK